MRTPEQEERYQRYLEYFETLWTLEYEDEGSFIDTMKHQDAPRLLIKNFIEEFYPFDRDSPVETWINILDNLRDFFPEFIKEFNRSEITMHQIKVIEDYYPDAIPLGKIKSDNDFTRHTYSHIMNMVNEGLIEELDEDLVIEPGYTHRIAVYTINRNKKKSVRRY